MVVSVPLSNPPANVVKRKLDCNGTFMAQVPVCLTQFSRIILHGLHLRVNRKSAQHQLLPQVQLLVAGTEQGYLRAPLARREAANV